MRILIIAGQVPYPINSGARLHTYNVLQRVAMKHEVWLTAFIETPEQLLGVEHLQSFCQRVFTVKAVHSGSLLKPGLALRYLLKGIPPDLRFYYSGEMARIINDLTSQVNFDVIHIEHSYMGMYLENLPKALWQNTIWCMHDIDWIKFARIASLEPKLTRKMRLWLHSHMMRRWQSRLAEQFACCTTVTTVDQQLLKEANPRLEVHVIPVGVDTKRYKLLPNKTDRPAIIFVGNMDYLPNADAVTYFCSDILPLIQCQVPGVEMWIVGIDPLPEVRRLEGSGVHVTGRVDDVRPYYGRSTVCVTPLRAGSGGRIKIMESMALGRPVISTSIGCEGLEVVDSKTILIANTNEEFAEKTVLLLNDQALYNIIKMNARKWVEAYRDYDVIAEQLLHLYQRVAEGSYQAKELDNTYSSIELNDHLIRKNIATPNEIHK